MSAVRRGEKERNAGFVMTCPRKRSFQAALFFLSVVQLTTGTVGESMGNIATKSSCFAPIRKRAVNIITHRVPASYVVKFDSYIYIYVYIILMSCG